MVIRILPARVIEMLSSRRHRLRHFLWHAVREAWNNPQLTEDVRQFIKDKGWAPPNDRAPLDREGKLILDNFSGEDFLYMHRQMIREVNDLLKNLGSPEITPWKTIPRPSDAEFLVPTAWIYADPSMTPEEQQRSTERLKTLKSDAYFTETLAVWESYYTNNPNLRRLTLGALGNLLEMTIHNNLHMRWASEPVGYMPSPNLENTADIDPRWDKPDYDYLGDTYSSHINPLFWYLHGWVDRCIDLWQEANGINEIQWVGTWTGKLEDDWSPGQPQVLTASIRREALALHGGHDHGKHDHGDLREMEEIVRRLGSCHVIRNFYDLLLDTP
jgi:hypothetical protein